MYLFLAILMLSCAQFGSQIFFPALPSIAEQFAISNNNAQQIMMLYFVSFGMSQLVFGPWSDSVGRRKVFLAGQLLFIIGCLLSAFATSPSILAIGRLLQGLGAGAPLIVSRTLLSDILVGNKLKQATASLAIAASLFSVSAPLLGGWYVDSNDWQSLFLFMTFYLSVIWVVGFKLLPCASVKTILPSPTIILIEYGKLIRDSRFINASSFKWLPSILYLTCVTYFPFEFQNKLVVSAKEYGFYMSLCLFGLVLGTLLGKLSQKFLSHQNILALFWPLLLLSGVGFYSLSFSAANMLICYGVFLICTGAYYPICLQLIIEPFQEKKGTAFALSGAIDMFGSALVASIVIKYCLTDMQSLGALFILAALLLAISWCFLFKFPKRKHKQYYIYSSK